MMRYRITAGHPIFEFWVEDTWRDCDIVKYFSTYESAENWIRTETALEQPNAAAPEANKNGA